MNQIRRQTQRLSVSLGPEVIGGLDSDSKPLLSLEFIGEPDFLFQPLASLEGIGGPDSAS